jgi:nitrate reductase NapA
MKDDLSRRDFVKTSVAAATAAAVGVPMAEPGDAAAIEAGITWEKSVCRFCGVGCGVVVGTRDGHVTAVKGDPENPVNRGLLCAKGYANANILYGEDRLTKPLLRMKDGRFDKNGDFTEISWQRAFDEMERQFKKVHGELGPTGVGIMGSGQYTIPEGYASVKLTKAGWRTNNIDPNARHCMASAVAAFIQVFGIDEPAGCYDDIELTDTVVTWGANMAEMHPMLWARVVDHRLRSKGTRVVNLTTYSNRTSECADTELVITPQTDLAIWNYIAREIVKRGTIDEDFVKQHCVFATGPTDIGFGMPGKDTHAFPAELDTLARQRVVTLTREEAIAQGLDPDQTHQVEQKSAAGAGAHWLITFDDFKKALEPYNLDFVASLAKGDPDEDTEDFKKKLQLLADYYAEPERKVVSFWTMGFNQHTRGTWVNEQAYMVHLLTGKQAKPGSGAFSLTGQPSACGTAREVGTFAHRLPADMVVANAGHRARSEEIWKLPDNTLNPKVGSHITQMMRDLESGAMRWLWVQVTNPFQSTANANHWLTAAREKDCFIVVSDIYPTYSCKVADLRQFGTTNPGLAPGRQPAGRGAFGRLAGARVLETFHPRRGLGRAADSRPQGSGVRRRRPAGCPRRGRKARLPARPDPLRGPLRDTRGDKDRVAGPDRCGPPLLHGGSERPRLVPRKGPLPGVPPVRRRPRPRPGAVRHLLP